MLIASLAGKGKKSQTNEIGAISPEHNSAMIAKYFEDENSNSGGNAGIPESEGSGL